MACTSERSQELGELAGARLGAAAAEALLAHVAGCAACSRELDLVADLLRAAPAPRAAMPARNVPRWVWGALALAAAVALLLFSLRARPPARAIRDLARLAPPPVTSLVLRGQGEQGIETHFDEALAALGAGDPHLAAERLLAQLASNPDEPLALFYLGVCRLQLGEHAQALAALERATELGTDLLVEQALWYRAQARLALDEGVEARTLLLRLVELDGDYEPNARQLLAELEPLLER